MSETHILREGEKHKVENVKKRNEKVRQIVNALHGNDELERRIVISQILALVKKDDHTRNYFELFIDTTKYSPTSISLEHSEAEKEDKIFFIKADGRGGFDILKRNRGELASREDNSQKLMFHRGLYENALIITSDFKFPLTSEHEFAILPLIGETGVLEEAVIIKRSRTYQEESMEFFRDAGIAIRNGYVKPDLNKTHKTEIRELILTNL